MKKRSALYFILLFVLLQNAFTQVTQPHRYEKTQKYNDDDFSIISMKEDGIALFRQTSDFEKGKRIWELLLLDNTLKETSNQQFEIDNRNQFIGFDYGEGELSLLFRKGDHERSPFELLLFNIRTFTNERFEIKPEINIRLTHFNKVGKNYAFGGYVTNDPAVILFHTSDKSISIVPGFFQKEMELVDVRTNVNQTFNTVLIDRSNRDDRKLIFRTFDLTGTMLLEDVIDVDESRTLLNGIISSLEREDLMIIGTWGNRNSKQAAGIYAVKIDPFANQKINYSYFGQLDHFLDYLKPKRAEKIKRKTKYEIEAGKNASYSNYVMPFKILEHEEGFILLSNLYNPASTFSQNDYYSPYNNYYYDPYWGYSANPRRVYYPQPGPYTGQNVRTDNEAIKTIESVLISFNENGKVKWDHSFALENIRQAAVQQNADFALVNGSIYFIYKKENDLKIKVISLDSDEAEESSEKIRLGSELDVLRSESEQEGTIRHWYNNAFYVWGFQNIRNDTADDKTRKVFYINKVVVD